jgi:hypothetical protein
LIGIIRKAQWNWKAFIAITFWNTIRLVGVTESVVLTGGKGVKRQESVYSLTTAGKLAVRVSAVISGVTDFISIGI